MDPRRVLESLKALCSDIDNGRPIRRNAVRRLVIPLAVPAALGLAALPLSCSSHTRPDETDEICDQCQSPMVVKTGRYGRFLACSAYPECKNVKPFFLGIPCPEDGCEGQLVEKQSRKGKIFYGCDQYPKCKFASWDKPVDRACPHCEAALMYERSSRGGSVTLICRVCNHQIDATSPAEEGAAA